MLKHMFRALQSGRRGVTDATGRAVLSVSKNRVLCAARGHKIVARPWVEIPGHYENWHRLVGCQCGKVLTLQSCSNYQSPDLNFLPPKRICDL